MVLRHDKGPHHSEVATHPDHKHVGDNVVASTHPMIYPTDCICIDSSRLMPGPRASRSPCTMRHRRGRRVPNA